MKKATIFLSLLAALTWAALAFAEPCVVQKGCLLSWAVGNPPAKIMEPGRAAAMAERAAIVTAFKNLVACMIRQGKNPPQADELNEGVIPPWVHVAGVARLADGTVMVTLSYCP